MFKLYKIKQAKLLNLKMAQNLKNKHLIKPVKKINTEPIINIKSIINKEPVTNDNQLTLVTGCNSKYFHYLIKVLTNITNVIKNKPNIKIGRTSLF